MRCIALTVAGALATGASLAATVRPIAAPVVRVALDEPQPLGGPRPSPAAIDAWRSRRFGMFIHFGLYSIPGGIWHGRRVETGYSEQILTEGHLDRDEYAKLAQRFDPRKFDADAIAALAKAAGMKFIVLTAKHHDGFNLFKTASTRYNMVDGTPSHRDLVAEMAAACRRAGLAFGVYYSMIDWHHPGGNTPIAGNSNPITPGQADFNVHQITELMSRYGPLSEIWFDMGRPTPAQSARFARTVHDIQPNTMVSGRVWNHQGDFTVLGDNQEPDVGIEEPWQSPASIYPETWGYRSWQRRDDVTAKIDEHIARLVRVASAGGNYILNIGPEGDGSVVPFEASVLRGIGDWLAVNGEAIYATGKQPFPALPYGHATLGSDRLYLILDHIPANGRLPLPGAEDNRFGTAVVLGGDGQILPVVNDGAEPYVDASAVRTMLGEKFMPVIAVQLRSGLHVRPKTAESIDGTVTLTPQNAERFMNYNGYGYDDASTFYKYSWNLAPSNGPLKAKVRFTPSPRPRRIALVIDGRPKTLVVPRNGRLSVLVNRDADPVPPAHRLEITPPEPFRKGDALPAGLVDIVLARSHQDERFERDRP